MTYRPLACVFLLLLSCSTDRVSSTEVIYRPSQIVRAGSALVGHRLRAAGYVIIGENTRELWDSREDFEQAARSGSRQQWDKCITFYYDLTLRTDIDRLNRSNIIASVTVGNPSGSVDIWACNESFVTAHRIESSPASAVIH